VSFVTILRALAVRSVANDRWPSQFGQIREATANQGEQLNVEAAPPSWRQGSTKRHQAVTVKHAKQTKVLLARVRARRGTINDVRVLDLSLAGCIIDRRALNLAREERVLIKLPGLALMPCYVCWLEESKAGLEFEQPLYEPVLDHLLRACAQVPEI
jgi:hypothetical protein